MESIIQRSSSAWSGEDNAFSRVMSVRRFSQRDDEEALIWAALEKLPTYDRMRQSILKEISETGGFKREQVDVTSLTVEDRQKLIQRLLKVAEIDNELFVTKLRQRMDRVGIQTPQIEVRFENLHVEADVHVGSRAIPSAPNFVLNTIEGILETFRIFRPEKRHLTILNGVSGIIKPSRLTLLLGPPGAGKTTLLTTLSGNPDRDLRIRGKVAYNGHSMDEFVAQRTAAYISQNDLHIPEMTVRETLDFSGRCQGVGARYELLEELSRREKQAGIKPDPDVDIFMKETAIEGQQTSLVTDYVLKILGLDICADTIVGNQMKRGISGGQKKRVTTGEMLVGRPKAFFMDEISTGLDSATTFQIVKCLRQVVHVLDETMVIALLQPAPETYDLFDDIILLSEGEIVYEGPREHVLEFFESQGFRCPERKGVADFLQEVTSRKDQEQYWADRRQPYRYIAVQELAEAFQSFHVGRHVAEELLRPYDKTKSHPAALTATKYGVNGWNMFKACLDRELLLMKREAFVYVFKTTQVGIMGLITMTVFFRTKMHHNDISDGSIYMGALFYTLIHMMFNGLPELSMTVGRLPVFYKQRDLLFYPAWAYSLPSCVMRIPLSLLEAAIWVFLTYYVIGFAPAAGRMFRQFLLLFMLHQMAVALFRLMAALGRNMVIANTFGTFMMMVVFVLGGFVISKDDIHSWWIWGYWVSPLSYSQNAIAVNEFLAPRWNKPTAGNPNETVGHAVLGGRGLIAEPKMYWIGIGALFGFWLVCNITITAALAYLNPLGKPQAIISEEVLDEKQSNRTGESNRVQTPRSLQLASGRKSSSLSLSRGRSNVSERRQSQSSEAHSQEGEHGDFQVAAQGKKGMVLPFKPLSLAFDDMNYFVDMPPEMKGEGVTEDRLQLLSNVSGSFRPGVLTALVGVSGAGKTTLMDVLAGRKTGGYIEGNITISGFPKKQETFARVSGYCEQNDIHSPNVTVFESLVYSAWLRLPREVDEETRMMFVYEVMELVELTPLRDAMVGLPGVTGLSTEQRKRLTIAVELVANPSIIFMDEPTSGLDARAAAIVMRTVRNTVDTGRTVVCTIHQPSIDIFEAFDELLLMKRGGRVIYAGPLGRHSHKLVEYFEAIPGIPKITEGYNPATWALEVSSVGVEQNLQVDFAEIYKNSDLFQWNQSLIKELSTPPPGAEDLHFPTQYAQSFVVQCQACLWKQHWSYWRNPYYVVVRLFFTMIVALLCGTVFWNLGKKRERQQDLLNVIGSMFAAVLFLGVTNATTVQPVVEVERTVFYREKAAGMYSAMPYAFGQVAIEVPYVLVQAVLYSVLVYAMIQFEWTAVKFFWYLFFMFLTFLYFTYYGMMAVGVTPNYHVAAIVSSAFYSIWNLFCGYIIPRPRIPVWWRWYYWGTPISWTLYGLVASQLGDVETMMTLSDGTGRREPVKQFLRSYFGIKHDFLGAAAGVLVGITIGFAVLFAVSIKIFNFQKR